jgi:hypothetical protein
MAWKAFLTRQLVIQCLSSKKSKHITNFMREMPPMADGEFFDKGTIRKHLNQLIKARIAVEVEKDYYMCSLDPRAKYDEGDMKCF